MLREITVGELRECEKCERKRTILSGRKDQRSSLEEIFDKRKEKIKYKNMMEKY